jgi:hypothetical protein
MKILTTRFLVVALMLLIANVYAPTLGAAEDLTWQETDGIALSLEWLSWKENDRKMSGIRVSIKNTSGVVRYFIAGGSDQGFHIFYNSSDGKEVQLHEDDTPSGIRTYSATSVNASINSNQTGIMHLTQSALVV